MLLVHSCVGRTFRLADCEDPTWPQVLTTQSGFCLSLVWCLPHLWDNWILLWCFLKLATLYVCSGAFWEDSGTGQCQILPMTGSGNLFDATKHFDYIFHIYFILEPSKNPNSKAILSSCSYCREIYYSLTNSCKILINTFFFIFVTGILDRNYIGHLSLNIVLNLELIFCAESVLPSQ